MNPITTRLHATQPARELLAELIGTALLVAGIVGSGIAAARLSSGDVGLQLLQNSTTTALILAVLVVVLGPVSGGHLNPAVSTAAWVLGRRSGSGIAARKLGTYVAAQVAGGVAGTIVANLMFDLPAVELSTSHRAAPGALLGEVVATAGLTLVVFTLVRGGRAHLAGPAVGAYVGAAFWFTSSTSFANPAVTIGRAFTDTFDGIAPVSVPAFIAAQMVGALAGATLAVALVPGHAGATTSPLPPRESHVGGSAS